MENRKKAIQEWITNRKEKNEINQMLFYITVPALNINVYKDETLKLIADLLNRNNVTYNYVDTVPGAWNLNRDWIGTDVMDCIVEYCGVYPINWSIDDIIIFEELETQGKIVVLAIVKTMDGKYIPNH